MIVESVECANYGIIMSLHSEYDSFFEIRSLTLELKST